MGVYQRTRLGASSSCDSKFKVLHLCPENRFLYSIYYTLFRPPAKLFNTTRDRKGLSENFQGLPHPEDLKGDPILCRDDSNINVGIVLSPDNGILMESVELRNDEGSILLLLRDTVLEFDLPDRYHPDRYPSSPIPV